VKVTSVVKKDKSRLWTLPAIFVVAVVTQIPFIITIVLSLINWNVRRPDLGVSFVGLGNYISVLTSSEFYQVCLNTIILTSVSLFACILLGLVFATLYNRKFRGVNICRMLILLPYFVTDSVIGLVWKTLFLDPSFGFNSYIARLFGTKAIDFFGKYPLVTIIVLVIWEWTPFMFLILMAGMQNMDESVVESAMIDGAHGLMMMICIKIPLISGHLKVGVMLTLINILKVFGLIYVTTQGGPGVASANLPYYIYRSAFYDWHMGVASTVAVLTVAITIVIINLFNKFMQRPAKERARS
jgi:sorbitol/mannitol transport system permease protein